MAAELGKCHVKDMDCWDYQLREVSLGCNFPFMGALGLHHKLVRRLWLLYWSKVRDQYERNTETGHIEKMNGDWIAKQIYAGRLRRKGTSRNCFKLFEEKDEILKNKCSIWSNIATNRNKDKVGLTRFCFFIISLTFNIFCLILFFYAL